MQAAETAVQPAAQEMKITRKTFDECMFPCYNPLPCVLDHGKGSYLFDTDGKRYVDFTAGIAVNSLGHCNAGVAKVIARQSKTLMHCSNIFANKYTLTLARELQQKTPFERFFFVNSGAEANECALKLARHTAFMEFGPDKNEIISFHDAFHGRTFFSVTVGGHEEYSDGFGPKPGAVTHLPFNDLAAFKEKISDKTCAVILEPVQGEGGIVPADPEFLKEVRALCNEHHALLIFDEVQTGNSRCGTLYAFEGYGVVPDILTTAKGLGGGFPLGAVMTSAAIAAHFGPGTHGSTFGGNPLACAVATYVLHRISKPSFLTKVNETSAFFFAEFNRLKDKYGIFKEIRGKGLLIGAVLSDDYAGKAGEIQRLLATKGLFVLTAGASVLRFAPALNIKRKAAREGFAIMEAALADYVKEHVKA